MAVETVEEINNLFKYSWAMIMNDILIKRIESMKVLDMLEKSFKCSKNHWKWLKNYWKCKKVLEKSLKNNWKCKEVLEKSLKVIENV